MTPSEAGAAMSAARRRTPKICPQCGKSFLGLVSRQTYCSRACKTNAQNARRRQCRLDNQKPDNRKNKSVLLD